MLDPTPRPLPPRLRGPHRPLVVPPSPFSAALAEGGDYALDPDGDTRRRTEAGVAHLPDGTTVAGVPEHALPAVARRLADHRTPHELAVLGGYGLPAARAQAEARELRAAADRVEDRAISRALVPVEPEVVEGELLDDDPHAITRTDYPSGTSWVCACGGWEAFTTGPSSTAWAGADHRRHLAEVTRAADA
jgi:hypothetical protein